jgi:hypothetical protein
MAQRVVAALWRFDASSLQDLRRILDGMIKTKQTYETAQQDTVRRAGQLQLDYRIKGEKVIEVPSNRIRDDGSNSLQPPTIDLPDSDA